MHEILTSNSDLIWEQRNRLNPSLHCYCIVIAIALPFHCYCIVIALPLQCHCITIAMAIALSLHRHCNGCNGCNGHCIVISLPLHCHYIAIDIHYELCTYPISRIYLDIMIYFSEQKLVRIRANHN